jgi:hypothetical protein
LAARGDDTEGRIARTKVRGRTRSAAQAERESDLLDPLYANESGDVPELDFERIKGAQPRQARERKNTGGARVRAVPVHRSSGDTPALAWLVPLAILAWGAYVFYGSGEVDVGSLGAEPAAAVPDDGSAPIGVPARARREAPGTAPAHLRDVVF